jgi:hypothetical protein
LLSMDKLEPSMDAVLTAIIVLKCK